MFFGRKSELASLESLYQTAGFTMAVIYGRRRIGKSTLINEFIKDKNAIFYTATKVSSSRNLELFSSQVLSVLDPALENVSFPSLEAVLDYLTKHLQNRQDCGKLILVIDELPYWAERDEALLSIFQKYIDTKWLESNLMIILCGSMLSFMESKVLSEKSPLFGRRSLQIRLEAFNYRDSALFVPNYSYEEKAICYGITGGVAKYLSLLDPKRSLDDNIKAMFFNNAGYLFDEPRNLLVQEFSNTATVDGIVEQIANGTNCVNEIAAKIHEKDQTVLYFLERLIDTGIVEKRHCMTEEKNRKKVQYVLKDQMFRFWYRFIPKALSVIDMGRGDLYYEKIVKPELHSFMGSVFEDMCRYYTLDRGINGDFGCFVTKVGSWWGTGRVSRNGNLVSQSEEIDVVAVSELDYGAVVGECKFKTDKISRSVLDTLKRRSSLISGKYDIKKYLLFSLSGFDDDLSAEKNDDIELVTLKDMYK